MIGPSVRSDAEELIKDVDLGHRDCRSLHRWRPIAHRALCHCRALSAFSLSCSWVSRTHLLDRLDLFDHGRGDVARPARHLLSKNAWSQTRSGASKPSISSSSIAIGIFYMTSSRRTQQTDLSCAERALVELDPCLASNCHHCDISFFRILWCILNCISTGEPSLGSQRWWADRRRLGLIVAHLGERLGIDHFRRPDHELRPSLHVEVPLLKPFHKDHHASSV